MWGGLGVVSLPDMIPTMLHLPDLPITQRVSTQRRDRRRATKPATGRAHNTNEDGEGAEEGAARTSAWPAIDRDEVSQTHRQESRRLLTFGVL